MRSQRNKWYTVEFRTRFILVNYLALLGILIVLIACIGLGMFGVWGSVLLVILDVIGLFVSVDYLFAHSDEVWDLTIIIEKQFMRFFMHMQRRRLARKNGEQYVRCPYCRRLKSVIIIDDSQGKPRWWCEECERFIVFKKSQKKRRMPRVYLE